eukprot:786751-Pleurochrysis_carterae.AAC.1
MRQEDPPVGTHRLSRAFRAQHFRAILDPGGWGGTSRARQKWAAALIAHNLLLRAGEVGHPPERPFVPTRDLTWASVQWMSPAAVSDGHGWALIHVVPIKDSAARAKAAPMPLVRRRRRDGPRGTDGMCAYDRLWNMRDEPAPSVSATERTFGRPSRTPLFVG